MSKHKFSNKLCDMAGRSLGPRYNIARTVIDHYLIVTGRGCIAVIVN